MKKITSLILAVVVLIAMPKYYADAAECEIVYITESPYITEANGKPLSQKKHNYTEFVFYRSMSNSHGYYCVNYDGFINEPCYIEYCGECPASDVGKCSKCGYGDADAEHTYYAEHRSTNKKFKHTLVCSGTAKDGSPCKREIESADCVLYDIVVSRDFFMGSGHRLSQKCVLCGEVYDMGYVLAPEHKTVFAGSKNGGNAVVDPEA